MPNLRSPLRTRQTSIGPVESPRFWRDGAEVAFLAASGNASRLWTCDLATGRSTRLAAAPGAVSLAVAPGGDRLALLIDHQGPAVQIIDPSGASAPIRPAEPLADPELNGWPGSRVLVTAAHGEERSRTLYGVDPAAGVWEPLAAAEAHFRVGAELPDGRWLTTLSVDGRQQRRVALLSVEAEGAAPPLAEAPPTESVATIGWVRSAGAAILSGHRGQDFRGLWRWQPDGELRLLRRRCCELESAVLSADGGVILAVWNVAGRSELELLDAQSGDVRWAAAAPGPVVEGIDLGPDGRSCAVVCSTTDRPSVLWLLHPGATPRELAGPAPPGTESDRARLGRVRRRPAGSRTAEPELVGFDSAGEPITGWLYRAAGTPGTPRAAVLSLHGGPDDQARPDFNPLHQALLRGGISVLAPNVRGSRGFGRRFSALDDRAGRWGARADVVAAARFALDEGVADQAHLGTLGVSYGGYLALCAAVDAPELFRAAVIVAGVVDLRRYVLGTAGWRRPIAAAEFGDPETDADLLAALSPLPRLSRCRAALLIVHGDRDTVVPVADAVDLARRLRRLDQRHRLRIVAGAGHQLSPSALASVNRRTVAWFRRWLTTAVAPGEPRSSGVS